MKNRVSWLLGACLALATTTLEAKVTLPTLLADNAVLQRNDEVLLWGTSDTGKKITITPSWGDQTYTTKPNKMGEWQVKVATGDAGVGYSISFDDGEVVTIDNILLGEVWLCSGQSNMEMPMKGFKSQPVQGGIDKIMQAQPTTPINYYKVKHNPTTTVQTESKGAWNTHTPEAVSEFSATAYYFASYIQKSLGVPVGIIDCSWSGSKIEAWMSRDMLNQIKEYDYSHLDKGEVVAKPHIDLCYLYNGMMAPLANYRFKGMLWYQGEGNRKNCGEYLQLFPTFIKELRNTLFDCEQFPVYYVEIAPYIYTDAHCVEVREMMGKLMELVPNSGMVSVVDTGEKHIIHPCNKQVVGERLAYWALGDTYKIGSEAYYLTPQYDGMQVLEAEEYFPERIAVRLKNVVRGVCFLPSKNSELFEVAGEDKVFYPAKTRLRIDNEYQIEAWSDQVPHPVAVRYAFKNFVVGDLFSIYGMPIPSFRSDDWAIE